MLYANLTQSQVDLMQTAQLIADMLDPNSYVFFPKLTLDRVSKLVRDMSNRYISIFWSAYSIVSHCFVD